VKHVIFFRNFLFEFLDVPYNAKHNKIPLAFCSKLGYLFFLKVFLTLLVNTEFAMKNTYKQNFIRAGALAKEVRSFGKSLIIKGASYMDVIAKITQKIVDLGARPAFPPQLALNEVAAHFLPQPGEDIIFSDQLIKLDVGVCYEGAIGDCAVTVDLSGNYQKLIEAAEAALLNAEQSVKVGQPVREIGKIIEETISSYGFKPVKNLCGHGLGEYKIHMAPSIPNCDDQSTAVIKPGMTFAIEPFATNGKGFIHEKGIPAIFSFATARPLQSSLARSVLAKIRTFSGLPFASHDLLGKDWSLLEVNAALDELIKAGVISGYRPLVEIEEGMVAQAENSVLVDEKGNVLITTR
jgi:methionyl aminopeptidase